MALAITEFWSSLQASPPWKEISPAKQGLDVPQTNGPPESPLPKIKNVHQNRKF